MTYQKYYVWSALLRLFHWFFAISIVFLSFTGLFIHFPWSSTFLEGSINYHMANMRFIHFVAGYIFISVVILRLYLFIFGNKYERIANFVPITSSNIKNFFESIFYYLYIIKKRDAHIGHNSLAGFTYLIVIIMAIIQILTGLFLMYPEGTIWSSMGHALFSSIQEARLIHYLIMWFFFVFILIHLYMVVWNDINKPEGITSSIINGYKFKEISK